MKRYITTVTILASAISLFHIAAQLVFLFFRWDGFSEPSSPSSAPGLGTAYNPICIGDSLSAIVHLDEMMIGMW